MMVRRNAFARSVGRGFTLIELLIALAVTSLAISSVGYFYVNYKRVSYQQEQVIALETNLRAASDRLTSNLRRADYGVPTALLPTWIDWVSGFNVNPLITQGATANDPDTISIAACTSRPIATVAATLAKGAGNTTVTLTSAVPGQTIAQLLDPATNKDLIRFVAGDEINAGFARVMSVSGTTVTFDTDPGASGNQGFTARDYFVGTPVCRVDVTTYTVDTGSRALTIDENQGAGVQSVFDGITNLQIGGGGNVYVFVVSGVTERPDPATGNPIPRQLAAQVTVRNQ